jgi:hypothetical protein
MAETPKPDLKSKYEFNSSLAEWLARLILVGLAVEIAAVFILGKSKLEGSLTISSTILILVGVWGELIFEKRAREAGDGMIAEANARAAEANRLAEAERHARVKLEAQLAPRALTKEQYDELQNLRGQIPAINVVASGDFEATRFAAQIAQALAEAGIDVKVCGPRIGLVWSEIFVVFPKPIENFRNEPLFIAFKKAGLSVGCGDRSQVPMGDLPPDIPVVMVGEKRWLLHPVPPCVWTLPARAAEPPQATK